MTVSPAEEKAVSTKLTVREAQEEDLSAFRMQVLGMQVLEGKSMRREVDELGNERVGTHYKMMA